MIGDTLAEFIVISDDVHRLSLLTLVYRAGPRPVSSPCTFSDACVQSARATLTRHLECMTVLEALDLSFLPTYVNW